MPALKLPDSRGFSLLEMSMVLAIIGLIAGGIMAGKSLIRAAEVKTVLTDVNLYKTAIRNFKDRYKELPGDFSVATSQWGGANANGADSACYMAQTAGPTATCNGNGNGTVADGPHAWAERFLVWKHLGNAGLVAGSFSGKTDGAAGSFVPLAGTTNPASSAGTGSFFDFFSATYAASQHFAGSPFPANMVTLYGSLANSWGTVTPDEAWNIDTKMDDGSPVTGNAFTTKRTSTVAPNCATSDLNTAAYDIANTNRVCLIHFTVN